MPRINFLTGKPTACCIFCFGALPTLKDFMTKSEAAMIQNTSMVQEKAHVLSQVKMGQKTVASQANQNPLCK